MTDDRFANVSEELKAKALACKSPEELHELAKSEGVELSLDDLDAAAGGDGPWEDKCKTDDTPC